MAQINLYDLKEEMVIRLRNADILSVGDRGVTTSQDTGTFVAANSHTLATNPTLLKNVRDITVGGSPLTWIDDYTVNYSTGVISFVNAQSGAYVINYDQGSTDKLFPDYPQEYLKREDFPRVGMGLDLATAVDAALGGASNTWSNIRASVICYDLSQKNVDEIATKIKDFFMSNKKVWKEVDYIRYVGFGPMLPSTFGKDKCFQRNVLVELPGIQEA